MNIYNRHLGSSKLHFFVGQPEKKTRIEICREGNHYYRVELGKKLHIGDIIETVSYLYRYNAEVAVKKGNKYKPRVFFFNRETALEAMREGYSTISLGLNAVLSDDIGYTHITSSDGKTFKDSDIPTGSYCLAFNELRLEKTFNQVKAEKLFEQAAEKGHARTETRQPSKPNYGKNDMVPEKNRPLKGKVKDDPKNWKFWVGSGIGVALTVVAAAVMKYLRSAG